MKSFILDSSVSASWVLKDETNDQAEEALNLLKDHEGLVPALWPMEMADVLVAAERKGRIRAADAARAVELLLSLPIQVEPGDVSTLRTARLLAREYGLSAYDACYLELAQRTGLALATLDRTLRKIAVESGVNLVI